MAHYQVTKAALNSLTRSAALELADLNVRVNTVSPGLTATAANSDQHEGDGSETWRRRGADIPLGRAGQPDDISGAVLFLCSDQARWITGCDLVVDGGLSIV